MSMGKPRNKSHRDSAVVFPIPSSSAASWLGRAVDYVDRVTAIFQRVCTEVEHFMKITHFFVSFLMESSGSKGHLGTETGLADSLKRV